ncbi:MULTISPECIES: ABC transporter permease [Streptomyces]|uniref:ABC transporter permease n=1 Tax=Streptomyces TaxID=1883 RepID=UPI002277B4B1|nr:ABC transporter permease [Streptomyces sp. NRRL S-475]
MRASAGTPVDGSPLRCPEAQCGGGTRHGCPARWPWPPERPWCSPRAAAPRTPGPPGPAAVTAAARSVWLAAIAFAVAGLVLKYHRVGRALYAIGGNADAARAAGIRVERVMLGVFVVAGVLAAVGGIMQTGYVGAISASQGQNMIFTVFAAAVIGGIALDGGKGTMFGALTGVLLLGVVQNLLTLAQVPSFWIQAIYGGIILVALMIARVTTGRAQD